ESQLRDLEGRAQGIEGEVSRNGDANRQGAGGPSLAAAGLGSYAGARSGLGMAQADGTAGR
ncbi:MAG: hypothetical protein ACRDT8_22340, partial [Micromonosporaceae bacterium]